ncbi:hypothetical protein CYLTODRAFT_153333 [Cylindrobasidium torrendii FP15055 ss-10]|uniref:Btz domain-containing protein n=1 Tax=Cylindrobasidium torrendii FP15055 ss-10 TaxID=1314674 RepID=A0A0D7BTM9_9AGAR|nr:hypothetical protein CYLTODRAFT_153333 [Cylindrobasidium torrendii FP15055 ss-10]
MSSSNATKATSPSTSAKHHVPAQVSKKKRTVRRRGGRAPHAMDSDEEIEREAPTDSDTDTDDDSSASDSDAEEDVPDPKRAATSSASAPDPSPFVGSTSWSEMVSEEADGRAADLPVIDFEDMGKPKSKPAPHTARKAKKAIKKPKAVTSLPSPPLSSAEEHDEETSPKLDSPDETTAQRSNVRPQSSQNETAPRNAGQTIRQVYQKRLETDPAYVPVVGEFWGHDDRLMDKDLRSLSGWWRGRGRGRGGFGPGMRGRGGYAGRAEHRDLPPVDRAWNHDGFEEMKRMEETRKEQQQRAADAIANRGASAPRARGVAVPRGRGGFFNGFGGRGGFVPSPARPYSRVLPPGHMRHSEKPELPWTKQADAYLHSNLSTRPRRGVAPLRVKLPGSRPQVVRSQPAAFHSAVVHKTTNNDEDDLGEVVVKLPPSQRKQPLPIETQSIPAAEPPKADDKAKKEIIDEVFTVRPQLVNAKPIPLPHPPPLKSQPMAPPPTEQRVQARSPDAVTQRLDHLSIASNADQDRRIMTEEAIMRNPTVTFGADVQSGVEPSSSTSAGRPPLPPIQTSFTPPAQPSPYMSPYQYGVPLPPGIAMNPLGMPFEIATGRPVYLPPPPQPQPMYNPMPPPFVPGHMHHHSHSMSTEFMQPPMSQLPAFTDPSTFALPRPRSVEIRAPGELPGRSGSKTHSRLRSEAVSFTPTTMAPPLEGQQEPPHQWMEQPPQQDGWQDVYQQPYGAQYYYPPQPDAYGGYGMPPYQMPSQYDMYGPPEPIPQGTVYYQ